MILIAICRLLLILLLLIAIVGWIVAAIVIVVVSLIILSLIMVVAGVLALTLILILRLVLLLGIALLSVFVCFAHHGISNLEYAVAVDKIECWRVNYVAKEGEGDGRNVSDCRHNRRGR